MRILGLVCVISAKLRNDVVMEGAAANTSALLLRADEVSEAPHGGVPPAILFAATFLSEAMIVTKPVPPIVVVYDKLLRAVTLHVELVDAPVSCRRGVRSQNYSAQKTFLYRSPTVRHRSPCAK